MSKYEDKRQLKCSFCGKSQDQVRRLIAGPNVYICDECVELCDEIIQEEIEETILVQGVIDLYYVNRNNELILVDYKTDYIEKNKKCELVNKYKKQLELYQEALEQSFNKKVSKKYIYSTCLGQAIEIQET